MSVAPHNMTQLKQPNRFSVSREKQDAPLRECVRFALDRYLEQMGGHQVQDVFRMVLNEVEPPMLEAVLDYCGGNQSRAAQMLGMSRSTLRKKLADYGIKN